MKFVAWMLVIGLGGLAGYTWWRKQQYAVKVPLDEIRVTRKPTPVV